jgi:hypothetical protein
MKHVAAKLHLSFSFFLYCRVFVLVFRAREKRPKAVAWEAALNIPATASVVGSVHYAKQRFVQR